MMSSLRPGLQACKQSLDSSLQSTTHTTESIQHTASFADPPLILFDSFIGLLKHLRQSVTTLSLSFKPPITLDAIILQLGKISDLVRRLSDCVKALRATQSPRSVLVAEWTSELSNTIRDIQHLLESLDDADSVLRGTDYLQRTGAVWRTIDDTIGNLSRTENGAASKCWQQDQEILKDAWTEFKGLITDSHRKGVLDIPDMDVLNGETDDFDIFGAGRSLSSDELANAERARPILALHSILHTSIHRYLFSASVPSAPSHSLLAASSGIVTAFDIATESFHPPQTDSDIEVALRDLRQQSLALVSVLEFDTKGVDVQSTPCAAFVVRWKAKLDSETASWEQRRMSMAMLAEAL